VALSGAHIQFENSGNGLVAGQINGAIRESDVTAFVLPALATSFNTVAQRSPCDTTCMNVRTIFDTGGTGDPLCSPDLGPAATCRNPDGSCAVAGDHIVSQCEVTTNSIMKNIFAPDVAMFDASGNYHPDPTNATKDSLSVGFGFVAVGASYQ
jgi:hypothetical protein